MFLNKMHDRKLIKSYFDNNIKSKLKRYYNLNNKQINKLYEYLYYYNKFNIKNY